MAQIWLLSDGEAKRKTRIPGQAADVGKGTEDGPAAHRFDRIDVPRKSEFRGRVQRQTNDGSSFPIPGRAMALSKGKAPSIVVDLATEPR
jgi:hypothetical protein